MVIRKIPWPQSDMFYPDIYLPDILEEEIVSTENETPAEEDTPLWLYPF